MKYMPHPCPSETVDIRLVDGVFVKSTRFPETGMIAPQHAHEFPHLSGCAGGSARVEADGQEAQIVRAGDLILIPALVKHLFTTLEPNTVIWCIHNADRAEGGTAVHAEHHLALEEV